MVTPTSEAVHLAAIIAHLNAGPASESANALSLSDLQQLGDNKPRDGYTEVIVVPRESGDLGGAGDGRFGGMSGNELWRVYTRAVAEREDNAQDIRHRVARRMWGRALTIGGRDTTEIRRSVSDDPIRPDEGWFSGMSEWAYAHPQA